MLKLLVTLLCLLAVSFALIQEREVPTNAIPIEKSLGVQQLKCPAGNVLFDVTADNRHMYHSCFSPSTRIPMWVFHQIDSKSEYKGNSRPPQDAWRPHNAESFGGSGRTFPGFDRGHLAPSSDFRAAADFMESTFSVINRAPQNAPFNQGEWRCLEMMTRDYASKSNRKGFATYIATGTSGRVGTVNERQTSFPVVIPKYYWKLLILTNSKDAKKNHFVFFYDRNNQNTNLLARTLKPGALVDSLPAEIVADLKSSGLYQVMNTVANGLATMEATYPEGLEAVVKRYDEQQF